jgi:hypothetical protein
MDEEKIRLREARFKRSCDRYAQKLAAGRGALRRDGDVDAQSAKYQAGFAEVNRQRSATAEVLDRFGVPTIVRPFYYSYILALGKRDRKMWSETQLGNEGRILVSLWVSRGLRRDVLLAIAQDVLGLDLAGAEPLACASVKAGV